jgi:hypothetical protein
MAQREASEKLEQRPSADRAIVVVSDKRVSRPKGHGLVKRVFMVVVKACVTVRGAEIWQMRREILPLLFNSVL